MMDLILITNDPNRTATADRAGVDRIMVDLEIEGKRARQRHRDTLISGHTLADVRAVRRVLTRAKLLVRTNPPSAGLADEVDAVLQAGAEILMLPMFTTAVEVNAFVSAVGGRARTCLLLETPEALKNLDEITSCSGIDEIHVGLNDLHIGLGVKFMFELVTSGVIERVARGALARGIKFGFGGVARLGSGVLDPRLILSEHVRLRSTQVILSRDFHRAFEVDGSFSCEVQKLRKCVDELERASPDDLTRNATEFARATREIASGAANG